MPESERRNVNQYLRKAEQELRGYRTEVNRLKTMITVLEYKERTLKEKMANYRSLLSPVHRLPPEILTQIFELCAGEEPLLSPDRNPAIVSLTQVCGRWRQTALSVPQLWCCVSLVLGIEWFMNVGGTIPSWRKLNHLGFMAELFTERSKTAPLSLVLRTCPESQIPNAQLDQALAAIACLLGNSKRWHRFECSHDLLSRPSFANIRDRLSNLARLTIDSFIGARPAQTIFANCPSLTDLDIKPDHWNEANFPLHQINSLRLTTSYVNTARPILQRCTNVRRLELENIGSYNRPDDSEQIILPRVECLRITATEEEDLSDIINLLTLSSLVQLEIRRSVDESSWWNFNLGPLRDFLLRSSCTITSLDLYRVPISDNETLSLLRLMPTLRTLSVQEYGTLATVPVKRIVTPTFLAPFRASQHTDEIFLPSLKDLSFTFYHSEVIQQALVDVVASRVPDVRESITTGPVAWLTSFNLTIMAKEADKVDISVLSAPLECFGAVGISISVSLKVIPPEDD